MSVLDAVILATCIGSAGSTHDACTNALQAGSKQSGIEENMSRFEDKVSKKADRDARFYIGDRGVEIVSGSAFVAKSIYEKSATIRLPNFGLCHTIDASVGTEQSKLNFEWKF